MRLNLSILLLCFMSIFQYTIGQKLVTQNTHLLNVKQKLKIDKCKIQFLKVTEDSRCPIGSQCIVPGTITISLRVNGTEYSLSSKEPRLILHAKEADFKIELLDVLPYPKLKQSNDYSVYQSSLYISKI